MPSPGLDRRDPAGAPRGVVLMLHGGAKAGLDPVGVEERLVAAYDGDAQRPGRSGCSSRDSSLWLLRFGVRGWNAGDGPEPSPVPDARWALDQAAADHPGVPVVLLGHSMGARTAVHVADHPAVAGVVALAPWLERSDPVHAAGRPAPDRRARQPRPDHLGARDAGRTSSGRGASPPRPEFVDMGRLGHYMLHRPREWNRFALRSTLEVLDRSVHRPSVTRESRRQECSGGRDG